MSNDSRNDDFPTIRLDDEDRRDYQQKQRPAAHTIKADSKSTGTTAPASATKPSGGNGGSTLAIVLILIVAAAASGGCYFLYQQLQAQKKVAEQAESRIAQLERKLSATGEEMGESTVAMQVKLTELTEKSNELWDQMDKLWASAWRRNQQEITELGNKLSATETSLKKSIASSSEDLKAQQNKLATLNNQISGLADEILSVNVQLEQAAGDKNAQAQSLKNLSDKISVLENRNNSLATQITSLRDDMRALATKTVSQPQPAN